MNSNVLSIKACNENFQEDPFILFKIQSYIMEPETQIVSTFKE